MRSLYQPETGYFLYYNEQSRGPFSWEELVHQPLTPDTLVWRHDMPEWLRADSYEELRQAMLGSFPQKNRQHRKPANQSSASPAQSQASVRAERDAEELMQPPQRPYVAEKPRSKQRNPMPQTMQQPNERPAMGISGAGCFLIALVFVLLAVGFIVASFMK